jgi:hypothetical protein
MDFYWLLAGAIFFLGSFGAIRLLDRLRGEG